MLTLEQAIIASGKKLPKQGKPYRPTQSDIDSCHKSYKFPTASGSNVLYDKKDGIRFAAKSSEDGEVFIDYAGNAEHSQLQISEYIVEFCKSNGLKLQ